jgi:hypothetical protein
MTAPPQDLLTETPSLGKPLWFSATKRVNRPLLARRFLARTALNWLLRTSLLVFGKAKSFKVSATPFFGGDRHHGG